MEKTAKRPFDVELGKALRGERVKSGYSSAGSFVEAIKGKTGVDISPHTLKRIERGDKSCTVEEYAAILYTLRPDFQRESALDAAMEPFREYDRLTWFRLELESFCREYVDEDGTALYPGMYGPVEDFARAYLSGAFDNEPPEKLYAAMRSFEALSFLLTARANGVEGQFFTGEEKSADALLSSLQATAPGWFAVPGESFAEYLDKLGQTFGNPPKPPETANR